MHIVIESLFVVLDVLWICIVSLLKWFIPTSYKSIEGEICLVTGGGSGIGRLIALEFAKRGAVLILWDINGEGNKETAEMINSLGGKAFADQCDISNRKEVQEAAARARRVVDGDITMLVNNADSCKVTVKTPNQDVSAIVLTALTGRDPGVVYGKDFMEMKDEEIEKTMGVNSLAHMWTVREFLPSMMSKNHGHIVTMASIVGMLAAPGMPFYVASKHAAVGFHNGLQRELQGRKKNGVKTTLVCPYHINTGMFSGVQIRFPRLIPSLEPEECVKTLMHAILTDQEMVALPRIMYVLHNVTTWLPYRAVLVMNEFLGTFDAMRNFTPTRSYQKDAATNNT